MFFYSELLANGVSPSIVEQNLLLNFDSQNTDSYPGNGNNWYDLVTKSASPKPGLSFDGNADYLSIPSIISFNTNDDYTIECWVYKKSSNQSGYTILLFGNENTQFCFDKNNAGSIGLILAGNIIIPSAGTSITAGSWHHLAWTRQGTTNRMFVNGVLIGSANSSAAFTISQIGRYGGGGYELNGGIDNLRITKGVARYTDNFSPPTTIDNATDPYKTSVSLLLQAKSSTIQDYSDNSISININGDVKYVSDIKQEYVSLFNGVSLITTQNNQKVFNFDDIRGPYFEKANPNITLNNSYTIGIWLKHNTLPNFVQRYVTISSEIAVLRHEGNGQLRFYTKTDDSLKFLDVSNALLDNTWYYIVATWDGTNMKLYKDSVLIATNTPGGTLSSETISGFSISNPVEIFCGYIPVVQIYNKALTSNEILQNYDALKSRYK